MYIYIYIHIPAGPMPATMLPSPPPPPDPRTGPPQAPLRVARPLHARRVLGVFRLHDCCFVHRHHK